MRMGGIEKGCPRSGCLLNANHEGDHHYPLVEDEQQPERIMRIVDNGFGEDAMQTGSDITTGLAANETRAVVSMRPATGYENVTDEYLAEQLAGMRLTMQSPQNKAILTEAAMRLVMRGGDDGYHDTRAVTQPTLEGLESRIEKIEQQLRHVPTVSFGG